MDSSIQLSPTRLQFPNMTFPDDKPLDKDVGAQLCKILKRRAHYEPEDVETLKKLKVDLAKNNHESLLIAIDNAAKRLVFPPLEERQTQSAFNFFERLPLDLIKLIASKVNDKESRKAFHATYTRFAALLNDREYLSNIINRNEFSITPQFYMNFTIYELLLTDIIFRNEKSFEFNGNIYKSDDFYVLAKTRLCNRLLELDSISSNFAHSQALTKIDEVKTGLRTEFNKIINRKFLFDQKEVLSLIEKCGDHVVNLDLDKLMGDILIMQRPNFQNVLSFLENCPNIHHLSLFLYPSEQINWIVFQALTKLQKLTELVIEGRRKSSLSYENLTEIEKIKSLQKLFLKYFYVIDDVLLSSIDNLPHMQNLKIEILGKKLPHMQNIQKIKGNHPGLQINILRGYMIPNTEVYKPYDDQNF